MEEKGVEGVRERWLHVKEALDISDENEADTISLFYLVTPTHSGKSIT